jgi:hypothetical protein
VGEDARLGFDRAVLPVAKRTGQAAYRQLGETVLLYRAVVDTMVLYLGRGRLLGVEHAEGGFQLLTLAGYEPFTSPVPADADARTPGVRRMLSLGAERFDEIVASGMAGPGSAMLGEAATAFEHQRASGLDTYLLLHDRVLERWRYRCVFTGAQFEPSTIRPHPHLKVVAIHARTLGGPLHVRNFLPMTADAEIAWNKGHITLGPGFGFQVAKHRIDPEFEEQLLPIGTLPLPPEPSQWPDLDQIAFHRDHIFDRDGFSKIRG